MIVVPITKRRKGKIYDAFSNIFHDLAKQKESEEREQGHLHVDRVPTGIKIPLECAVSNMGGHVKGNSAISIAGNVIGSRKKLSGDKGLSPVWRRYHIGFFR